MAKNSKVLFSVTYAEIAAAIDGKDKDVRNDASRGNFNPNCLESVCCYIISKKLEQNIKTIEKEEKYRKIVAEDNAHYNYL